AARKTSQVIDLPIDTHFHSLTYEGSGYSVLSSNPIIADSITADNVTGTVTFNSGLTVDTPGRDGMVVNVTHAGATLQLDGILRHGTTFGAGAMTKIGPGELELGGNNTVLGQMTLVEGVLTVTNSEALGSDSYPTVVAG